MSLIFSFYFNETLSCTIISVQKETSLKIVCSYYLHLAGKNNEMDIVVCHLSFHKYIMCFFKELQSK